MKVELIKYPSNSDWFLVKELALSTCDMKAVTEPSTEWKEKMLLARHSPIRELHFIFKLEIPYWVSVHLCRHIHAQPYVKSQRNDRQKIEIAGYDRNEAPQNTPVVMFWSMGAEELINVANKRLCTLASKETREVVAEMCKQVVAILPEFKCVLVPNCEAHGNTCYEIKSCHKKNIKVFEKE